MRILRALAAAFSYFSIFPGRTMESAPDGDAIAMLPIVGLVIGAASGWAAYGMFVLTHSTVVAAIVAWVLSIALSGAIHVDGFLDCCDGLFAMATPERRLEIMRDPHHGTYAIVGMAILSVVWLYALASISPTMLPWVLMLTAFLARWGAVGNAMAIPNHRTHDRIHPSKPAATGLGISVLVVVAAYFRNSMALTLVEIGLAFVVSALVGTFAQRRLGGGITGDCYGASITVTEAALLLAVPYLVMLR